PPALAAIYGVGQFPVVVVDEAGNVVVGFRFSGTATIAGKQFVSNGNDDLLIASFVRFKDSTKFIATFGGVNSEALESIAVDSLGNILLAGFTNGAVDFGGGALMGPGSFL